MNYLSENIEEILSRSISGFHSYVLTEPFHVDFVSENLCKMTLCEAEELISDTKDCYMNIVHPSDREAYTHFLERLSQREMSLTLEYRIIKKDGSICFVSDTMTSKMQKNGTMAGYSTLTDITELKNENEHLQFLNETIPCGFLKYTCEKQPRITYINDQMLKFLRFPEVKDGEIDYLELYKGNIFLMIPMEERRRFAVYLKRVYKQGAPIAGEMSVLRIDGSRAHLFGWVTKCINDQGVEEFQSVCMDVTESYRLKKERETERYLKALTEVYDKIFEYDLSSSTVKCLYGQKSPVFRWIENIPMQMVDATNKWIIGTVFEDDRERIQKFFDDFYSGKLFRNEAAPPQITYRAISSTGKLRTYTGIFLKIDSSVNLFCCRNMPEASEAALLRHENASLRNMNENMQELVMRFTDGIAAFEVTDELVTPLYASDNVCEFFGFTKDEWIPMMKKSTPIKDFVSRSAVAYRDFAALLQSGEAEFTYFDLYTGTNRRIKAICSEKDPGKSPRYIMLYDMDKSVSAEKNENNEKTGIYIRTFGYFDVFVDGRPIAFRNEKSKELFALLVDRRGGFVSSDEAIGFLWENESANSVTLARYRKVALRLKNILEEYGISDVVESVNGKRRIATDKVKCDLYDYLSGNDEYAQLFKGSYLSNYSWAETTLAELAGDGIF